MPHCAPVLRFLAIVACLGVVTLAVPLPTSAQVVISPAPVVVVPPPVVIVPPPIVRGSLPCPWRHRWHPWHRPCSGEARAPAQVRAWQALRQERTTRRQQRPRLATDFLPLLVLPSEKKRQGLRQTGSRARLTLLEGADTATGEATTGSAP